MLSRHLSHSPDDRDRAAHHVALPFRKIGHRPLPGSAISAARYRDTHWFEIENCIGCDLCATACPVACIYTKQTGPRKIDQETGIAGGGGAMTRSERFDALAPVFNRSPPASGTGP